jgi:hypothetical protein
MAMSFFLITIFTMTNLLFNLPQINFVTQLDVFNLQFEQLIMRGNNYVLEDDQLCFDIDTRRFCVKYDHQRLVKTPGYEILLDEVIEVRLELEENEITVSGYYDKKRFVLNFKIE